MSWLYLLRIAVSVNHFGQGNTERRRSSGKNSGLLGQCRRQGQCGLHCSSRARAGLGQAEEAQPQRPVLLSGSACALLELSLTSLSSCPKDFTYSHLRILEECQETGLLEALLRYLMQLQDKGVGLGAWARAPSQRRRVL